jgi:serine/threonine-protein kinase/endoribonuclease IRE1
MPSDAQVLYQIANGIDFLHKGGLSHGQLNPNTILIAQPLRMKVSDFRLSRCIRSQTKDRISTSIENKVGGNRHPVPQSRRGNMQDYEYLRLMKLKSIDDKDGISHPTCWMLSRSWESSKDTDGKEIITPKPATVNGDVVAAGCIFFYFLTRGSHPFGSSKTNILINLAKMDPVNLKGIFSFSGYFH